MEAGIQYYYTRVILSGSCLRGSVEGTKINSLSYNFFLLKKNYCPHDTKNYKFRSEHHTNSM
jgi:hypothetical protein